MMAASCSIRFLCTAYMGLFCFVFSSCSSDTPTEPPVIPADTTGPAISLVNPVAASSVGDTLTVQISSQDSLDIDRVAFRVDSISMPGGIDSVAPFEYNWTAMDKIDGQQIEFSAQAFDTAGNSRDPVRAIVTYRWNSPPVITFPVSNSVIGDTVTISASLAAKPILPAYIEFLRGGIVEPGSRDSTAPYSYLWNASQLDTASAHQFSVRAVDVNGNTSASSQVTYHFLWRQLLSDADDSWPRDVQSLAARSTATQLQFRMTTYGAWTDYRSETNGLASAIFLDTDQNPATGATGFTNFPFPINDIGADFRLDVGFFGDSLWTRNGTNTSWIVKQPLTSVNLTILASDSVFELSVNRSAIGNSSAVDIVVANIFLPSNPISWDFAPDQGNGHVSYTIDGSFMPTSSHQRRPLGLSEPVSEDATSSFE